MFNFEYHNNNSVLTRNDESEIYDFFCKLVLNAELTSVYNCVYDHGQFKLIASKFGIANITNKHVKQNELVNRGYHFYFDINGNLIKLERYIYNGILELTREFDNNHNLTSELVSKNYEKIKY